MLPRRDVISLPESKLQILRDFCIERDRGCSLTSENAAGYPLIALSWIQGSRLEWSDTFSPRVFWGKAMEQLAMMHVELV